MVIKAVILTLKEEIQGMERNCLKLGFEYDRSSTSELGWELEEKTFGVRLKCRGNIYIQLMETWQSFSLRACTHGRSWEPKCQRTNVGIYSREEGRR